MTEDLVIQTELERPTDHGTAIRVIWLPQDSRVKVGTVLTLKGETEKWKVRRLFTTMPVDKVRYIGWKVGGLD
jgi:hypothetical protein